MTAQFGGEATAARVGLPLGKIGRCCTEVIDSAETAVPIKCKGGIAWAGVTTVAATRREWGESIWAACHAADGVDPQDCDSTDGESVCPLADDQGDPQLVLGSSDGSEVSVSTPSRHDIKA